MHWISVSNNITKPLENLESNGNKCIFSLQIVESPVAQWNERWLDDLAVTVQFPEWKSF